MASTSQAQSMAGQAMAQLQLAPGISGGDQQPQNVVRPLPPVSGTAPSSIPPPLFRSPPLQMSPQGMQAPPQGMQAPPQGMQAPPQGMQAPPQGIQALPQGMQAPPQGMQAPPQDSPMSGQHQLPSSQLLPMVPPSSTHAGSFPPPAMFPPPGPRPGISPTTQPSATSPGPIGPHVGSPRPVVSMGGAPLPPGGPLGTGLSPGGPPGAGLLPGAPPGAGLPPGGPPGAGLPPGGPPGAGVYPGLPPSAGPPPGVPRGAGLPAGGPPGPSTSAGAVLPPGCPPGFSLPPSRPPGAGLPPPSGPRGPMAGPSTGLLPVPPGPTISSVGAPRPLMRMPPPSGPPGMAQHMGMAPPTTSPGGGAGLVEVWLEHKTADGRTYYSHPQTQKTTWERPPNAQIVSQPPTGTPLGQMPGLPPPFSIPHIPGMPHQGPPQLVPTRVWSEHQTPEGKTYFYNKVTRQSIWEKPKDFDLVMPLPVNFGAPSGQGSHQAVSNHHPSQQLRPQPHPHHPSPNIPHRPPLMAGGVPPHGPLIARQTGHASPVHVPQTGQASPVSGPLGGATEGKEREGEGGEEEGKKEEGMDVGEDVRNSVKEPAVPAAMEASQEHPSPPVAMTTSSTSAPTHGPTTHVTMETEPHPQPHPPPKEEPKGPRPIASIPIAGTPWSVVWTSDERMFFFDAISRVSVWSTPEELASNPSVQKVIDEPPWQKKRVGELKESAAKRQRLDEDDNSEGEDGDTKEGMEFTTDQGLRLGVPVLLEAGHMLPEAAQTEKKGSQIRAGKTPEERQKLFKEMLLERGVSAFSTWEKELPKFIFDPRYMLLNTKERKSCFEAFIRSRAEEERKEKKSKLKEKRDQFHKLLEEAKLSQKSSFSDFALKYGKDERFKGVERMREREQQFSEFIGELKRASKLKEEHHKQQATRGRTDKVKSDFMAMLGESVTIHELSQWRKVRTSFDHDPRYKAVESSTQREEWFNDHTRILAEKKFAASASDPEQVKQDRIQASLKEREREVKLSRSAQEKEWGRERDQLRKMEAVQHFKALLVDMVRNADATWHDTRRQLHKDHRWELVELLDTAEREQLFREHVEGLSEKKRLQFRKLLEETHQVTLTMPWKKARKLIKDDPRYKNFSDSDHRRETEYDKHLHDKMIKAKEEFRALLRETKIITYRSLELIEESEKHYRDIVDILQNDQRYLILDCVSDERESMLQEYLHEMKRRGPPPPPTASNPSDRLRRP